MLTEPPGVPSSPVVENIRGTSTTLSWRAPKDDGGSKVDGYVLEYREDSGKWIRETVDLAMSSPVEHTLRGLKADAAYEFRVAAKNKSGVGEFSDISKSSKTAEESGSSCIQFCNDK